MRKHNLIIYFDATSLDFAGIQKNFEEQITNTILNKDLFIYYLKYEKQGTSEVSLLYKIFEENGKNVWEPDNFEYEFRDFKSLSKCFDHIYYSSESVNTGRNYLYWYFLCVGHGFGYNLFSNNIALPREEVQKRVVSNLMYIYNLKQALNNFHFKLGVFNTCDFTLIDNLYFLSKKFTFIVAPQNYTSLQLFNVSFFLTRLNARIVEQIDSYKFSQEIYLKFKKDIAEYERTHSTGPLVGSSIFFFRLLYFFNLIDKFNKISEILLWKTNSSSNYEWYKRVRDNVESNTFDYIDTYDFLIELKKEIGSSSEPELKDLIRYSDQIIWQMDKIQAPSENIYPNQKLHGFSIYLPEYHYGIGAHYDSYKMEFPDINKKIKWYNFMELIVEKTKRSNFISSLVNKITALFR